jgi:hypothetical protein
MPAFSICKQLLRHSMNALNVRHVDDSVRAPLGMCFAGLGKVQHMVDIVFFDRSSFVSPRMNLRQAHQRSAETTPAQEHKQRQ